MARALTEEEYLRLENPARASGLFNSRTPLRTSTRKARLYLCACCRRVWDWLGPGANRAAVEAAERAADHRIRVKDLRPFWKATTAVAVPLRRASHAQANPASDAAWPHTWPLCSVGCWGATWLAGYHRAGDNPDQQEPLIAAEQTAHCALIHDLLGNPFRPVSRNTDCLTPVVVGLAQAVYDERILPSGELDLSRLAVLSDALEDAGCTELAVLDHLRSPGPHVRGCWALDLILGKS